LVRLKFLFSRELRLFGRDPGLNDPTHIHSYMLGKMLLRRYLEQTFEVLEVSQVRVLRHVRNLFAGPNVRLSTEDDDLAGLVRTDQRAY
jgi:hypothetical protein